MMSEGKDISSSNTSCKISQLLDDVKTILEAGMREGYENGYLDLEHHSIDDSMVPEICKWLTKLDGKIRTLDLGVNKLTSDGASMLFNILRETNSLIRCIDISSNKDIDDKCMKSLGEYIKSNKSITGILLGSQITDFGLETLAPYLDGNTTLNRLYLNENNGITDKSIPLLIKTIESSHIQDVNIGRTSIKQQNGIVSPLALNQIRYGSVELILSGKNINDEDLIKICEFMRKHGIDNVKDYISAVSSLHLSRNKIGDQSMKALGEYVQDNEKLESLDLSQNKITDLGIEILSEHLSGNTKLNELHLSGNGNITSASTPYLLETLKQTYISKIDLFQTTISAKMQQEIGIAQIIPVDQREIPIKSNTKSAAKISTSISGSA